MDVSIVIVSYNTNRLLDECIKSIQKETSCAFEIIVVDNASTDGSCMMLRERHPGVTLIENSRNAGFAKANNQGFSQARGRYFLMLNPDTVILDGAIDKLVDFMDRNHEVGICGPRNVGPDGALQFNCDHFPSIWNTFCYYSNLGHFFPNSRLFNRCWMSYWDYNGVRDVDRIVGCSLLIRSDLYKNLYGLNEKFFMYFEETDFCLRAHKKGYRVSYFPEASIIHYGGGADQLKKEGKINTKSLSYYFDSQKLFFNHHYGYLSAFGIRTLDLLYGIFLLLRNIACKDSQRKSQAMGLGHFLIKRPTR